MAKNKILIVDDSELNRSLLSDMLEYEYDIIEAENGRQAVAILHEHELDIRLVLLDIVMPVMDGFETLAVMNKKGWIKNIPVIMISAETGSAYTDRAYDLGAIDYISRPFDERTVRHRVNSNVMLAEKQKDLSDRLSSQILEKEKDNRLMIEILSNIVEFRNGESGLHVLHVHTLTELLLKKLISKTDKYALTQKEVRLICNASALHDVGKIAIPSKILNKPGRFTQEEFEIMKTHSAEGEKLLDKIPLRNNEPLIKYGRQICRWHHERYDGSGYPDGLKGEEIPIAAQVVALADVYDALTSQRCYKNAYPPHAAVSMILNGECGAFNPLLLECLTDIADVIERELNVISVKHAIVSDITGTVEQMLQTDGSDVSNRTVRLLENERMKLKFLSDLSREIVFEYTPVPEILKLSEWGAEYLGTPEIILDPAHSKLGTEIFSAKDFAGMLNGMRGTSPQNPVFTSTFRLNVRGESKWFKIISRTVWADGEPPECEGAIGKIVDVNDETLEFKTLQSKADTDSRTGLLNHEAAKSKISAILREADGKNYALILFDLDNFKQANDKRGHLFGDEVLEHIAEKIRKNIRSSDIAARMGGDEFIIFMEYGDSVEPQVKRIFGRLSEEYDNFSLRLSMGIACTDRSVEYDKLFSMADKAMYAVKGNGKNGYRFYDRSLG